MLENQNSDKQSTSKIISVNGPGDPVFFSNSKNNSYQWVFIVLFSGLITALVLFVLMKMPETAVNSNSELSRKPTTLIRDVELLKGQMNALIAGDMEIKLQQLETSLQNGIISRNDLATVKELEQDLKALKRYSAQNTGMLSQTEVIGRGPYAEMGIYSKELLQEINTLQNLFYVSIASWGIAIMVFGVTWLNHQHRIKQIQASQSPKRPMLIRSKTGSF